MCSSTKILRPLLEKKDGLRKIKSWDGRVTGYFSYETLNKLANQIGILGPLGAMFGRNFEQEIMSMGNRNYLPEAVINRSVIGAPYSTRTQNLYDNQADAEQNYQEENQGQAESSTSRRLGRDAS